MEIKDLRHDLDGVSLLLAIAIGRHWVQVRLQGDQFFVDTLLPSLIKVVKIHGAVAAYYLFF